MLFSESSSIGPVSHRQLELRAVRTIAVGSAVHTYSAFETARSGEHEQTGFAPAQQCAPRAICELVVWRSAEECAGIGGSGGGQSRGEEKARGEESGLRGWRIETRQRTSYTPPARYKSHAG